MLGQVQLWIWVYVYISFMSGQDGPNRTVISYPSPISPAQGYPLCPYDKSFNDHLIKPLLTKLVQSRWLDIGLVLFLLMFVDIHSV